MPEIKVKETIKIVQIMAMENNSHWQGHVVGLADDGKVYIDVHTNCDSGWELYIENKRKHKDT